VYALKVAIDECVTGLGAVHSPFCQDKGAIRGYASQVWESMKAFWSAALGWTSPKSLLST
jgi:hypothetical protein